MPVCVRVRDMEGRIAEYGGGREKNGAEKQSEEVLKKMIKSHPLYGLLIESHLNCLKVTVCVCIYIFVFLLLSCMSFFWIIPFFFFWITSRILFQWEQKKIFTYLNTSL